MVGWQSRLSSPSVLVFGGCCCFVVFYCRDRPVVARGADWVSSSAAGKRTSASNAVGAPPAPERELARAASPTAAAGSPATPKGGKGDDSATARR